MGFMVQDLRFRVWSTGGLATPNGIALIMKDSSSHVGHGGGSSCGLLPN